MSEVEKKKSTTLKFVIIGFVSLVGKFLAAGMTTPWGTVPPMTAGEFGIAFGVIMGIWLGREYRKNVSEKKV